MSHTAVSTINAFYDLNPIEDICHKDIRDVSHCLTINSAHYDKLYAEMPFHVLAEYKARGDSTVL